MYGLVRIWIDVIREFWGGKFFVFDFFKGVRDSFLVINDVRLFFVNFFNFRENIRERRFFLVVRFWSELI